MMTVDELFSRHSWGQLEEYKNKKLKFVHYTSAAALVSILQKKEIWLRNTSLMNDYQEIERGIQVVLNYFGSNTVQANLFWNTLDECFTGISNRIKEKYNSILSDLKLNTYVMSFSAHPEHENNTGRLSMWRAYAPKDGVAIILGGTALWDDDPERLGVYTYPALYWSEQETRNHFDKTVGRFVENNFFIQTMKIEEVIFQVTEMLVSFAICLKHPGFAEEAEIRIVYRPNDRQSTIIKKSVEIIGTMPQTIYKIPLSAEHGTDLDAFLDRVIIGPSTSTREFGLAVFNLMVEAGITNADQKIFRSDIPLRV